MQGGCGHSARIGRALPSQSKGFLNDYCNLFTAREYGFQHLRAFRFFQAGSTDKEGVQDEI